MSNPWKFILLRTFLRGLGAAVALPLLDAMQPALAATGKAPVRLAFLYVPNGIDMANCWRSPYHPGTTPPRWRGRCRR